MRWVKLTGFVIRRLVVSDVARCLPSVARRWRAEAALFDAAAQDAQAKGSVVLATRLRGYAQAMNAIAADYERGK